MRTRIIIHLVTYLFLIYLIIIVNIIMNKEKKEESNNKTEQAYLDICSDFKNLIQEKDLELKKHKTEILRYKKLIGKFYGLARAGEEMIQTYTDEDDFIERIFNVIRSDCSNDLFFKTEQELGLSEDEDLYITINLLQ